MQQCSSARWKKGKISFVISARRELIHRPLSLHRTTDRSSLSPSLSPVLSALLEQLSFRTNTVFWGPHTAYCSLTQVISRERWRLKSRGDSFSSPIASPKMFPLRSHSHSQHTRGVKHMLPNYPAAQTKIFTRQLILRVESSPHPPAHKHTVAHLHLKDGERERKCDLMMVLLIFGLSVVIKLRMD